MLKIIKRWLCRHKSIMIETKTSTDSFIITWTLIQCSDCKKTFPNHPNAKCCYVEHIHSQVLYEQFIQRYKSMKQ